MFLQRVFEDLVVKPAFAKEVEHSRALTLGERALARRVYGDQIDLDKVRVHSGCLLKKFRSDLGACVVGSDIYYTSEEYSEDFSKEDLSKRVLFVHELMHVNQSQHGLSLSMEFVKLMVATRGNYVEAYRLPAELPDFKDCNIEQQAVIVAEAYRIGEKLKDRSLTQEEYQQLAEAFSYFMAILPPQYEPIRGAVYPA